MISAARLRRAVRRETIGVDVGAALNLVGALVKWFAPAFLLPAAVAAGYGEPVWIFLVPAAVTAAVGSGLELATSGKERVGSREGYLVVSLLWLLIALLASVPYLLSGEDQFASPVDSLFEAMSGLTTTGASVLTDIPAVDRSLLIWRQLSQWFGGLGIVVLAIAILPRLRVGGRQALFQAEAPGPELESFPATIRDAARRFVLLYVGLTAVGVALLAFLVATGIDAKMTFFDAVAHPLTAVPTGGFSPRALGAAELGAAGQWALVPLMLLGGVNFALLYVGIVRRRASAFMRDDEFRAYLVLLVLASALVLGEVLSEHIAEGEAAVRQAVFNTVSMFTTTGLANADFNEWTSLTAFVFLGGMLISASAGSTAGGIKLVRHVLIAKMLRRELDQTVHPELVSPVRLNGRVVDEKALRAVVVFAFIYVGLLAVGATVILLDSTRLDLPVSPFDAIASAATAQASVGPSFGLAGPFGSFEAYGHVSKVTLMALMWLGRLEIIPILVLFTKRYWRA